jgi:hypothetical protein
MKRFAELTTIVLLAATLVAACAPTPAAHDVVQPVMIEHIEGTDFSRVVLTEKAVERLGLQVDVVREETVTRKQMFAGEVFEFISIPITGAQPAATTSAETTGTPAPVESLPQPVSEFLVRVHLTDSELNAINREPNSARILPLGDEQATGVPASERNPDEIQASDTVQAGPQETALYFGFDNSAAQLAPGQRVLVELALTGDGTQKRVLPLDSVIYGLHGETWVYTNPQPLVFVRQPITIDYMDGELVYLTDGPTAGTPIIAVGAAMLYGAESGVGGGGGH